MGLSRNKVAVPEGAAGTPPFWRDGLDIPETMERNVSLLLCAWKSVFGYNERKLTPGIPEGYIAEAETTSQSYSSVG